MLLQGLQAEARTSSSPLLIFVNEKGTVSPFTLCPIISFATFLCLPSPAILTPTTSTTYCFSLSVVCHFYNKLTSSVPHGRPTSHCIANPCPTGTRMVKPALRRSCSLSSLVSRFTSSCSCLLTSPPDTTSRPLLCLNATCCLSGADV